MKSLLIIVILIFNISHAYSSETSANDWILEVDGESSLTFKNKKNITLKYKCSYYSDGFNFKYDKHSFTALDLGFYEFYSFVNNDSVRIKARNGRIYDDDIIRRIIYHYSISIYSNSNDEVPRVRPNFQSLRGIIHLNREKISSCEQERKSRYERHVIKNIAKITAGMLGLLIIAMFFKYSFLRIKKFKRK